MGLKGVARRTAVQSASAALRPAPVTTLPSNVSMSAAGSAARPFSRAAGFLISKTGVHLAPMCHCWVPSRWSIGEDGSTLMFPQRNLFGRHGTAEIRIPVRRKAAVDEAIRQYVAQAGALTAPLLGPQ